MAALKEIREGAVTLSVPDVARPEEGEVFYNPVMRLSRDVSVCAHAGGGVKTFCDPLAATGARGLRIAAELGISVTCGDRSAAACELIRKNATRNGVDIELVCGDANALLASGHWDAVDLDPFGSPADFLDLSCKASKRFLAMTATDPAALCGVYPRVARRRYLAEVVKTEFYHEVGVRVLAGFAVRMAAKYDVALRPELCHSSNHYYRAYFSRSAGGKRADEALEGVGFLDWCPSCLRRAWGKEIAASAEKCPGCGGPPPKRIGPLYLGEIFRKDFCDSALGEARERGFAEAAELLRTIAAEAPLPPFHYDHHWLCHLKRKQPGKLEKLLEGLRGAGFSAARTHFCETGFRTDAPLPAIMELV